MSAAVSFSLKAGNTFTKFESTDGEMYVLKCQTMWQASRDPYNYNRHTQSGFTSNLTLEWKQKSTKFIRVCVHESSNLDKSILASNATSASLFDFRSSGNEKIIVYVIPYVALKESLPTNSDNPTPTREEPVMEKKLEQLSTDMNHLLESGDLSDVMLTDGSMEIRVHKLVLSARSSVFAKMLRHPMKENKENRITIKDTPMEVLRELLHFMYSGTVNIKDPEMARALYVAADKYDVQDLRGICSSMLKSVDLKNVLETLLLADLYNDKVLKEAALNFIFKNYSLLKTQGKWSTFMKKHQALAIEILSFVIDKK